MNKEIPEYLRNEQVERNQDSGVSWNSRKVREHSNQSRPQAEEFPNQDQISAPNGELLDGIEECLVFLCRHFELPAPRAAIRADRSSSSQIIAAEEFSSLAEKIGITTVADNKSLENINWDNLPAILFLNNGGAVVALERNEDNRIAILDPTIGDTPIATKIKDLEARYNGTLALVRPAYRSTFGIYDAGLRTGRHWFWGPLTENFSSYIQMAVAAATTNFLSLAVSVFIMVVYDRVLPNEAIESLVALTVGVVVAIMFDFLVKILRASFIDANGEAADFKIASSIFNQLLNIQMRSRRGSAGSLASALREFESLREFFTSASLVAIVDLPFIFFFVFVIYLIGGALALVPAVAVPIIIILGIAIQPFLQKYARENQQEGQTKQGVLVETITGLETIKTTRAAALMRERWEDSIRHQSSLGRKTRRFSQLVIHSAGFAQQATQIGVVFFGVFLISSGDASMGAVIASVILVSRTLAPLGQLAQTMTRLNEARTSYRALDAFMNEGTELGAKQNYVSRPKLEGGIEFREVSFSYPGQTADALERVSFKISPGEKVAIVGRIGSGKSTLIRLLLGLYEPDQGAVLVDDTDIRQIHPAELRDNIGAVLQDSWLFTGTIRQNIAVGAHHPSDEKIRHAAEISGVNEFVSKDPRGFDLQVSECGGGLSGGQRQAITIARSIISDPSILVMDEPTSMMDMQSERSVIQNLKKKLPDQTLIVVTHRTSVLELVDRVIVLDQGTKIADGPQSMLKRTPERQKVESDTISTSPTLVK